MSFSLMPKHINPLMNRKTCTNIACDSNMFKIGRPKPCVRAIFGQERIRPSASTSLNRSIFFDKQTNEKRLNIIIIVIIKENTKGFLRVAAVGHAEVFFFQANFSQPLRPCTFVFEVHPPTSFSKVSETMKSNRFGIAANRRREVRIILGESPRRFTRF